MTAYNSMKQIYKGVRSFAAVLTVSVTTAFNVAAQEARYLLDSAVNANQNQIAEFESTFKQEIDMHEMLEAQKRIINDLLALREDSLSAAENLVQWSERAEKIEEQYVNSEGGLSKGDHKEAQQEIKKARNNIEQYSRILADIKEQIADLVAKRLRDNNNELISGDKIDQATNKLMNSEYGKRMQEIESYKANLSELETVEETIVKPAGRLLRELLIAYNEREILEEKRRQFLLKEGEFSDLNRRETRKIGEELAEQYKEATLNVNDITKKYLDIINSAGKYQVIDQLPEALKRDITERLPSPSND